MASCGLVPAGSWQGPPSLGSPLGRRPSPVPDCWAVLAFRIGIVDALDDLSFQPLLKLGCSNLKFGDTVDDIDRQVEAVHLVADRKFQRSVDIALFFVPAHMDIGMIRSAIGELVNQPGISMKVEDHRLVSSEDRVEVTVGKAMRMFGVRLQPV